jgi:hypothetical protein
MAIEIQTNPEAFFRHLPVHTVTGIDRVREIAILSGSDGSSHEFPLSTWGNIRDCQPDVGSKVQLLEK